MNVGQEPVASVTDDGSAEASTADLPEEVYNEDGSINVEALQKAYLESIGQTQSSAEGEEQPKAKGATDPKEGAKSEPESIPNEPEGLAVKKEEKKDSDSKDQPKVDFKAVAEELALNGDLSEDTLKQFKKMGMTEEMVDVFVRGAKAEVQRVQQEAFEIVGGKEAYGEMSNWMVENLSDAEIEAYNRALADDGLRNTAISGMFTRWQKSTGQQQNARYDGSSGSSIQPFSTISEMQQAMSDPRYTEDERYRAEVEQRLAISNIL